MKRFKDIKPGDKIYYLCSDGKILCDTIKRIKCMNASERYSYFYISEPDIYFYINDVQYYCIPNRILYKSTYCNVFADINAILEYLNENIYRIKRG